MVEVSDLSPAAAIDRSERRGHVWLVLLLAGVLVGALVALLLVANEQATPLIYGLMSLFSMAGVFFLFAYAIGALQFMGRGARDDLTKLMADTAAEGCLVVEDGGRIVYANESYLLLAGGDSPGSLRPVERLFTGAPEVSEAIYRLAQAAREHRAAISAGTGSGCGLCPVRVTGPWRSGPSPTSRTNASGRRTSSRNSSTRSTTSTTLPPAFCRSIRAAPSST